MNIDDVARLAVAWFVDYGYDPPESAPVNRDRSILMTAIAGAESGYSESARGDKGLNPTWQVGGYCSFGLWQIYLPVHHSTIAGYMGIPDEPFRSSAMAEWLMVPDNNARAARDILGGNDAKPTPWSTYKPGPNGEQPAYKAFVAQATAAVDAALNPPQPVPPPEPQPQATYILRVWPDFSVTVEAQ